MKEERGDLPGLDWGLRSGLGEGLGGDRSQLQGLFGSPSGPVGGRGRGRGQGLGLRVRLLHRGGGWYRLLLLPW